VEQETHPLSDTEIGEILAIEGHFVARRTVAKYRSMEGILPAHLRSPVQTAKILASLLYGKLKNQPIIVDELLIVERFKSQVCSPGIAP
jgi:hypothetical protein